MLTAAVSLSVLSLHLYLSMEILAPESVLLSHTQRSLCLDSHASIHCSC